MFDHNQLFVENLYNVYISRNIFELEMKTLFKRFIPFHCICQLYFSGKRFVNKILITNFNKYNFIHNYQTLHFSRDPRGFAIKFYTEDGIWDLVGNNTPIFFIRDPILFSVFIHSQKRNPATNLKVLRTH